MTRVTNGRREGFRYKPFEDDYRKRKRRRLPGLRIPEGDRRLHLTGYDGSNGGRTFV